MSNIVDVALIKKNKKYTTIKLEIAIFFETTNKWE